MREFKAQLAVALLVILTVAAVISAGINFQQQNKFHLPDDGATWVDRDFAAEALHLVKGSPAERAGLKLGDQLLSINGVPIEDATDVPQVLVRLGAWSKAEYLIRRDGVEVKTPVIIGERLPDSTIYYQYLVGLIYLSIGLFVYFRRGNADKARHFLILCLASFVLSTFHYTGKLNNFDKVMYWGNVAAGLLAPTIFLHFCLTFPERHGWLRGRGRVVLVYVPATLLMAVILGAASGTLRMAVSLVELRWLLDRLWLPFMTLMYLAGGAVLSLQYRRVEDSILRHQLKWLRNGTVLGILPFALFYVVPYTMGFVPGEYMKMAVLSMVLIPLTWGYAIVRYRLMDVDVIFQQGYVYTLATLCVLGIFYGMIFSLGKFEDPSPTAVAALILIAAFVFQPIRAWMQEQLDKYYFYKDRYDYRRTLIEFARELSSETDLDAMLSSVADRLLRTLSVRHLAFFLADEVDGRFHLKMTAGENGRYGSLSGEPMDLSFLSTNPSSPYMFFEQTRHPLDVISRDLPTQVRQTIADLDLTYYLPCSVRGRVIAYVGVSRTGKGDFLTSDDVELLVAVSGYVGIAIENARLYRSLQQKAEAFERLKEFNENIVESINVGILAADLNDRVESWNSQMEQLTGILREDAVGRTLAELFPRELVERFDRVRGETGIHHVDKFAYRPPAAASHRQEQSGSSRVGSGGNGKETLGGQGEFAEGAASIHESTLNIAIAPLVARDLQQIGRLIICDDVTDRTELERRLVQADRLSSIGLLAAGVAHEVNTPLAVISTYAQTLARQVSGDDEQSRLLEKIATQTFRASEIVNSLLNFSRTSPKQFHQVDLNRVIHEAVTLIQHQLEKARIEVKLDLEEPLPLVRGDSGKLQQVLLNLCLNARDAMESGGALELKAWSESDSVRVTVSDTGQGIHPEHLQRIYDPFFTTKAIRKGTGLGLSVTYGIVREHGGVIEVESRPGEGTRFHLEFPVARTTVNA